MTYIQLPESFVKLVKELFFVFSPWSQPYFLKVISGLLLVSQRKSITAALRLSGINGHWSNLHRFLSQYAWKPPALGMGLVKLLIHHLHLGDPLLIALDDTLVAKRGRKIFGRSHHFDPTAKANEPQYIWGHNWVVLGLLHWSSMFSKWVCFPFWARLFIAERSLPPERPFKSKVEIAVEMLQALCQGFSHSIILVADALYAKASIVRWCLKSQGRVTFISRLRHDAALFAPVKPSLERGRGRPRKYGPRLASLWDGARKRATLHLYERDIQVQFRSITAYWKPAGGLVQILVVLYPEGKHPTLFLCTDLALPAEEILRYLAARWKIEVSFQYLKTHGGLADWQCRVEKAVERSATLNSVALSLLILWSLKESSQEQPELWDHWPWYRHKESISLPDMLRQLRAKSIERTIFSVLAPQGVKPENIRALSQALKMAA